MSKLDCHIVKDLLPAYVDGLTSPETGRDIEEHLITCKECREEYEAMKTPEVHEENHREINYLKKIRSFVSLVIGVAVLCTALFTGVMYYRTSKSIHGIDTRVSVQNGNIVVKVQAADADYAIRSPKLTREGTTVHLEAATGKRLPFSEKDHVWMLDADVEAVTMNGYVIYDQGTIIKSEAAELFHSVTPYVGNASAVVEVLWNAGIEFSGIELKTDNEPYGLIIKDAAGELDVPHLAAVLACIENLSWVETDADSTVQYRLDVRDFDFDVKSYGKSAKGIQTLLDMDL